jgi:endonuclease/exonuclease/phosphatase (EEP) superfamily protein YafD
MMTREDIIYLAGLVDGEGTVSMAKEKQTGLRFPTLSVASTTTELVDWCKATFGGIRRQNRKKDLRYKTEKTAFSWLIGHDRAMQLMRQVLPHMKEPKKRRRIEFILQHYKAVTMRNGHYSPERFAAKMKFQDDFFAIS